MIPYSRQFITPEDIQGVIDVLDGDIITRGKIVKQFEQEVADYVGMRYAVSFNSGTSALYGAYQSLDLDKGWKFITSPISFCATSNMGVLCGGHPVFVDVDKDGLIDTRLIRKKLDHRTRVVVPVDYSGHPVNHHDIDIICKEHNVRKVCDCCHSLGSSYVTKRFDTFSDMTVFSFHPVKTITTGEGGMVTTNREDYYERLKRVRNHGLIKSDGWNYELGGLGFNFHMTDFQAALGLSQLGRIDEIVKRRHEIFVLYNKLLGGEDYLLLPFEKEFYESSHHLYYIRLRHGLDRKMVYHELHKRGVGCQVHYIPIYWFEYYKKRFKFKKGLCPMAEKFYNTVLSLPCYVGMTDYDVKQIVYDLKEVLEYVQISQHN